jgi:DNA topoisomerase-1
MKQQITERTVLDPGYRRAYRKGRDETAQTPRLANYRKGQRVQAKTRVERKAGLNEADLIRLMRYSGVGRPSTYAATLEALKQHGYIEERDGQLLVTGRGRAVLAFVQREYPGLFDVSFTAEMEQMLDDLASGKRTYASVLEAVWEKLR